MLIKKLFRYAVLAIMAFTLPLVAQAEKISPPNLAVNAYLLTDFDSGNTIAAFKPETRLEPASLTKIMTAYLAFEAIEANKLKLNQTVPVSKKAWKMEGSRMFLQPDKKVTVDQLLHGLIIQSGNDAAVALAEAIAGSEETFAQMMNQKAKKLGLIETHYMNATGLPHEEHYTTAADLSKLATALIRDFPLEYKRLYSVKEYRYNNISQKNRNRLLWLDANVDGMKTGHTNNAGYCLIASSKRQKTRLISVVLGAVSETSRAVESQKLLNYGFQFFDTTLVFEKGQTVNTIPVWKGASKTVNATVSQPVYFTLPKGDYAKVKAVMTSKQPLLAPIQAGKVIGSMKFSMDGKVIREVPLVAANNVAEGNIFNRMIDSIKLFFK